jgi:hypothetical protein
MLTNLKDFYTVATDWAPSDGRLPIGARHSTKSHVHVISQGFEQSEQALNEDRTSSGWFTHSHILWKDQNIHITPTQKMSWIQARKHMKRGLLL